MSHLYLKEELAKLWEQERKSAKRLTEALTEAQETKHYRCSNCGYEADLTDAEYDGCCPNCHEHHGEFEECDDDEELTDDETLFDFDESLNEAIDFNTIFNSSGFEQNVINKMSFLSNKINGKVRRFIYEYIENKFDDLVFEIKDLETDGLSKKEIISILADDVYEENPKLKYYVNDLAEFIYRTVKYIISSRQDESLTEDTVKQDDK